MAAKPIVLPDTFTGEASWDDWMCHFENVADVNGWDDDQKLKFLKVRLTGRAQKAFQHLNEDIQANYSEAKRALRARFEPQSKKTRYQAEFQSRRKKKTENWADFAEDLRTLTDKAFPELEDKARERLALNSYLNQLDHPQVAFGVKQRQPDTLDEAVTATLEMESYVTTKTIPAQVASIDASEDTTVTVVSPQDKLTSLVEKLLERVERLETSKSVPPSRATRRGSGSTASRSGGRIAKPDDDESPKAQSRWRAPSPTRQSSFQGSCWRCGKRGHIARNCQQQISSDNTHIFQVNPTGGYRISGKVNGVSASFLVDTGAAVTLIRDDIWRQTQIASNRLEPWTGRRLLGVDGSPLQIHGRTEAELELGGHLFTTDVVIAACLSTEAILGLDFLEKIGATIDLVNNKIILADQGGSLMLQKESSSGESETHSPKVYVVETIWIPPTSEMEIMATVKGQVNDGSWLLEGVQKDRLPVAVARALVEPKNGRVPVRLVNPRNEAIVVYKNMKLATLEQPEELLSQGTIVASAEPEDLSREKQKLLWDLVEKNGAHLLDCQKDKFYNLLCHYSCIFATSDFDLGQTSELRHCIETGNAAPVRQAVRRLPPARRKEVQDFLKKMQEKDVIQQSTSPWASPIVLVKKKDGSTRFCVDYRRLNEVTRKDAYPLPRIDSTLDTLAGSQWFSTLDLISGYWQVEIEEKDRPKTAFCTTEGLYEFKVMPFGLCNAPATFQRLMDLVLAGLQWSRCLVYIDDVIVLGHDFEDHLQNLQAVFQRLHQAGLKLKPVKCAFFQQEVQYLGHLISPSGVMPDPSKIEKVAAWPAPTSIKAVQQFLGFANYYRRFIKDFARIAKPLHRLTEHGSTFSWSDDCKESFEELRKQLSSAPLLIFPDFSKPFILDTDASDIGIGAVLSQTDTEGKERVIAYGSRLLSKPERKYCVTRRELLAVVVFTHQFRPYLFGHQFVLRTDHGSITWLRNFKEPEGQLARWLEKLQEFDFKVVHRCGRKHTNADALSRLPCKQCKRESHHPDSVTVSTIDFSQGRSIDELSQLQRDDPVIGPVIRALVRKTKPDQNELKQFSLHTNRLFALWDQLTLQDSVLYRRFVSADGLQYHLQFVAPRQLHPEILEELHSGAVADHLGEEKTLSRLKQRFYWPGHWNDVRRWCQTCSVCAASKTPPPKKKAALKPVKTGYPMQLVAVDILGPLPESDAGNSYLLVIGDYFTRWMEAFPIPNQEAITVARTLVDKFFCRFGLPEQLHSDQGRQFESELLQQICNVLRIKKSRTTPYHPQSDGVVERFNRTLISMLSTCATEHPFKWEDHVQKVCMAYNTSVQVTTSFTPYFLMFGREARLPIDLTFSQPAQSTSTTEYAAQLLTSLNEAYQMVRERVGMKQNRQKEVYDKRIHGPPHSPGDLVWLHNVKVPRGTSKKFHKPWTGPYRVLEKISDQNYQIENTHNLKKQVVHFDRLKRCNPDTRFFPRRRRQHPSPQMKDNCQVGANIEIIDQPDAPIAEDNQPHQRRYPLRERQPPDRLSTYISH